MIRIEGFNITECSIELFYVFFVAVFKLLRSHYVWFTA